MPRSRDPAEQATGFPVGVRDVAPHHGAFDGATPPLGGVGLHMRPQASRVAQLTRLALALTWVLTGTAAAEEQSAEGTVKKTKDALHFQLPPDWPVEKRGGMTVPIPVEEYLGQKFKAIESRLQALEQRFNGFDVRVRVLEEALKNSPKGLRSSEHPEKTP